MSQDSSLSSDQPLPSLARLITSLDETTSPLGAYHAWPTSLKNAVQLILPARAEIVMFWGPDYIALYNDAYAPTIGEKHPSVLGRPASVGWRELWDDLEPLLRGVRETGETYFAKDRPFYIERHGFGEEVYFDISYSAIPNDDGSVGGVLCIVSETTERVRAQRQAVADRDRLWNLSRDPLLIAMTDGVWISASPAWTRLLGWTESELIGRTSEWMEHPDDTNKTRKEIDHLSDGEATDRFENRFRAKDGSYRWFSWTAVADGDLLYCVARDITAEKHAAAALHETEEALRQAQKMETIGQLTGGVSHDFNNLLQIIIGNLDLLLRGLSDDHPRLKRAAGNAMNGAQRAAVLTQRLLAFARKQPLAPTRLDPLKLVAGMSELLRRSLGETIEVEITDGTGVWPVEVDANQLENAILNLAVNARDAMPNGGALSISIANTEIESDFARHHPGMAVGEFVEIAVQDNGTGMDAGTLEKAFEPFFTTKEAGKGTGLGLSMVYGFVKQSGGHVRLDSKTGEGTTVVIYLPRSAGNDDSVESKAAVTASSAIKGETILVCEDNDDVRTASVEMLEHLGYRVIEAPDGPSAIALMESHGNDVDLLFTDVVLPHGMTGAVVAQRAVELRSKLKVLFTSGYARDAIIHDGRLDAGVELITKPFTSTELANRIRSVLDR